MKIIIVGGNGTIGSIVKNELSKQHDVITASRTNGDVQVDITDSASIKKMYETIGQFDALIATTGQVHFAALGDMKREDYGIGLQSKLMGQVDLVLLGLPYIAAAGCFTLTSGILSHDPIRFGSSASMVNGALDSFTQAAAIEMPRGIRINAVSPTVLTASMKAYDGYFPGFESVSDERVALAYRKSVEGLQTGQIYRAGYL